MVLQEKILEPFGYMFLGVLAIGVIAIYIIQKFLDCLMFCGNKIKTLIIFSH